MMSAARSAAAGPAARRFGVMAASVPARARPAALPGAAGAALRRATYMVHQQPALRERARSLLAGAGARLRARHPFALGIGGGLGLALLHSATGSADDFYDYRYVSHRDPDDLASFYGGEELMELFCVFPLVGQIMMRNAQFDDTGSITTTGFPGQMHVDMVFSDETNDATGQTDWFNKRERFRNTLLGFTLWDMVLNFGFRTKEDGTRECYHAGEYFHGNAPLLSQLMLLVFKVHARWVVWSVEHHVNHYAFSSDDDEANARRDVNQFIRVPSGEEMEHESRANMPLFLLRHYAWKDLYAMLFGYQKDGDVRDNPSFLVTDRAESDADADDDEDEDEDDNKEEDKLPFQTKAGQLQISEDIAADKKVMKELLRHHNTQNAQDVRAILQKRHTLARRRTMIGAQEAAALVADNGAAGGAADDARVVAMGLAAERLHLRRRTRRATRARGAPPAGSEEEDAAEAAGKAAGTVISSDAPPVDGRGRSVVGPRAAPPRPSPAEEGGITTAAA